MNSFDDASGIESARFPGRGKVKYEQGVLHIGGLLIVLFLAGAAFYFFAAMQQLPQMEEQIEFLEQRINVMQKQLDDIDLRQRISELKPEK